MTEHIRQHRWIDINRQPRTKDDPDYELMVKNKLRVYRSSPEAVTLQIRGEKLYATVNLSTDDVQWLVNTLTQEASEIVSKPRAVA
jgi:hypothetical protein